MESVVITAQQAGFTLIELMIVIVLVAIFVVVGVPNFQNLVSDNRLSTQANRLVSSLQLARSEALKLRSTVSVCRSTDGATCAGAGAWDTGWLVFVDDDQDGVPEATDGNGDTDAGERVIQSNGSLSASNTLRAAAAPFNNFITYQPSGLQNAVAGSFRLCDGNNPDVNKGRLISISTTGRVQSQKASSTTPLTACP